MSVCEYCRAELPENATFCGSCGRAVGLMTDSPTMQGPTSAGKSPALVDKNVTVRSQTSSSARREYEEKTVPIDDVPTLAGRVEESRRVRAQAKAPLILKPDANEAPPVQPGFSQRQTPPMELSYAPAKWDESQFYDEQPKLRPSWSSRQRTYFGAALTVFFIVAIIFASLFYFFSTQARNTALPTILKACEPLNNSVSLTLIQGQSEPASTTFALCAEGGGEVTWNSSWDQQNPAWLQVERSGKIKGGESQQVRITATASTLSPGPYYARVDFSQPDSGPLISLNVNLEVVKEGSQQPNINVSPTSLTFTSEQGRNPGPQTITLSNGGPDSEWSSDIATDKGGRWIRLTPEGGMLRKDGKQDIVVNVNSSELAVGKYSGKVTLLLGVTPIEVPVTLNISAQPQTCIRTNTSTFTFNATSGESPAPQTVTITNCGPAAGNWSAEVTTQNGNQWLSVNPASGSFAANASQNVNIEIKTNGLAAGTYNGRITFRNGENTTAITVSLVIQVQPPCVKVEPTTLSFDTAQGAIPDTSVTLSNECGAGDWKATSDAAWLSSDPTEGALQGNDSLPITIKVDSSKLPANTNTLTGHLTFTAGESTATLTVTVTRPQQAACIKPSVKPPPEAPNPPLLIFTVKQGETATQQIDLVNECGPGSWTSTSSTPWLTIEPNAGPLKGNEQFLITVKVDTTKLPAGDVGPFKGEIAFKAGDLTTLLVVTVNIEP